ncbi:hypothetical protein [Microbacterium sp. SD291]|uniref:hypothetical protein n=1 Tax=Microbacterium sp. SD291 TaxID=2782007 RepID=UPI001A969266|nr:hypothetical protein [Microbacterium sp. SD291]MBO0979795.1 hypothetical protein [Microbacterium sp. SD291]
MFEKVQRTKPELGGAEENLAAARTRLMAQIHEVREPARVRSARGPWLLAAGVIGVAAAVTAGVLIAGDLTAPAPTVEAVPTRAPGATLQPTPEPTEEPLTASKVLQGAAQTALTSSGPVAGEGQYLRVEHATEQLVLYDAAGEHTVFDGSRAGATAAWVVRGRYITYIPADRDGEWVRVFEAGRTVVALYGTDAQQHQEEWSAEILDEDFIIRTPGGIHESYPGSTEPNEGSDAYYALMPRDPQALVEWFRSSLTGTEPANMDSAIIWGIVQTLELNAAPADLRAALYQALDLLPGLEIVSTEGAVVTLAFEPQSPLDWRETVTIDRATGLLVASARTFGEGSPIVPDSVPNFRLTNTISVVDSAP